MTDAGCPVYVFLGGHARNHSGRGQSPENPQTIPLEFNFRLGGFKKALRGGVSVEAPKPNSDALSGRFPSDSGALPACNSDFCL